VEFVEDSVSLGRWFLILQTHNWTVTPPALATRRQETRDRPRERYRTIMSYFPITNSVTNY
jgi:hypothetical protein